MASVKPIQKLIDGVIYKYDREFDIISNGCAAISAVFNRTQVCRPVDICIECTTRCNMTCENCFSDSRAGSRGAHARLDDVLTYLQQSSDSYIRICLTGGEPLLHPRIEELLGLPDRIGECGFVLSTNGTVRKDLDGALAEHQWLTAVSLHGTRETHNKYTRSQTFDMVRRRIERLAPATTTHIYSVIHEALAYHDVDWLIRFREDSGAAFLRFIVPRAFGRFVPGAIETIARYVGSRCDLRSAVKREPSLSRFLSVDGDLRPTH